MKKVITLIVCIFTLQANAQEKLNKFHVVDSLTVKPVPSTTISIVRAKLSITTEQDGIFIIPGDLAHMRDTVILDTKSYRQVIIPLNQLSGMDTIRLVKLAAQTDNDRFKYTNQTLLNDYKKQDVVHYAGINTPTANFDYLQLAQQFNVFKTGTVLISVTFNRLAFGLDESDITWTGLVHLDVTKFRIRIYDVDPITKGPGRDLCDKVIEESKSTGSQVTINLKKYNILLPDTSFFIAIEWMRDFYNAGYVVNYDAEGKETKDINYHPAIGISPITGKKLNIWGMGFNHKWKPFTYFMPFGTDLAMKAVVGY